jgi:hypothetical protein
MTSCIVIAKRSRDISLPRKKYESFLDFARNEKDDKTT